MKAKLTLAIAVMAAGVALVFWTPQPKVIAETECCVKGRTLCPWCPPVAVKVAQQGTPVHPKVRCNPCAWENEPNRTWDGYIVVKHWRSEPAVL